MKQLKEINLNQITADQLNKKDFPSSRPPHAYPSEASCVVNGKVIGGCMRASYYRCTGVEKTNDPGTAGQWRFKLGNAVEATLVDTWKQAGIYVANHTKFYSKELNLSGELDAILEVDGVRLGTEIKSAYGFFATKEIMGTWKQPGYPKLSQLLQTFLYTYHFRDLLAGFKMFYVMRDSGEQKVFNIGLHKEVLGTKADNTGKIVELAEFYPTVQAEDASAIDPFIDRRFPISAVHDRYRQLKIAVATQTIPDREYELLYDDATIDSLREEEEIGKIKYDKWVKAGKPLATRFGSWNCAFCSYKGTCRSETDMVELKSKLRK